jgi:molybdopterin-binding protein
VPRIELRSVHHGLRHERAVDELELKVGVSARAVIKASDVMIAID